MYKAMKCAQAQASTSLHAGWLDLQSNPYAWVCLRIWPDNLILSVAAGGDVVWSSFSAGIFYHMERLENKQYIVHVQSGPPKVSYLAPPTSQFFSFSCCLIRLHFSCALHYCHIEINTWNVSKKSSTQYMYNLDPQKCPIWLLLQPVYCVFLQPQQSGLVVHYIIVTYKLIEHLKSKQYIVHLESGPPKVSFLAPPTAQFLAPIVAALSRVAQLCITFIDTQNLRLCQLYKMHEES